MGFISTLARRMRINHVSKRLSTTSTKLDEDSNDLIKTTSETASLNRASMDSTSTMVQHSFHEPVLPDESPANRQMRPDTGNMRTLFDGNTMSRPTDRATKALSRPVYPILKLDCRSPVDAPRRVLLQPLELGNEAKGDLGDKSMAGASQDASDCSSTTTAQKGFSPTEKNVSKKDRRSMTALLKRHCGLNIPRPPVSLKTSSRNVASPKWLDSAGLEEEGLVGKQNEKWEEVQLQEKRRKSVLGSVGFGRLW